MPRQMLFDCFCPSDDLVVMESSSIVTEGKELANGRVKFRGPYTEMERENRNRRVYPKEVMHPQFEARVRDAKMGKLTGELDHPSDSILHAQQLSHRITSLWWDKSNSNIGWGEAVTLPTPFGLIAEALFHEKVPLGVSSRGVGAGTPGPNGINVIQPGFKLITWDIVVDPSYQDAWQETVQETKRQILEDASVGRVKVSMYVPEKTELIENILDVFNKFSDHRK